MVRGLAAQAEPPRRASGPRNSQAAMAELLTLSGVLVVVVRAGRMATERMARVALAATALVAARLIMARQALVRRVVTAGLAVEVVLAEIQALRVLWVRAAAVAVRPALGRPFP